MVDNRFAFKIEAFNNVKGLVAYAESLGWTYDESFNPLTTMGFHNCKYLYFIPVGGFRITGPLHNICSLIGGVSGGKAVWMVRNSSEYGRAKRVLWANSAHLNPSINLYPGTPLTTDQSKSIDDLINDIKL